MPRTSNPKALITVQSLPLGQWRSFSGTDNDVGSVVVDGNTYESVGTIGGDILLELPTPQVRGTAKIYCPKDPINLEAYINWQNLTGLSYQWQYKFSDEPATAWKNISAIGQSISIDYESLPGVRSRMENEMASKVLEIRARAVASGQNSAYGIRQVSLAPAPPTYTRFDPAPSCTGRPTGVITVSGISGLGRQYRWILKTGASNTTGCIPKIGATKSDALGGCFTDVENSGMIASNTGTLAISDVPTGDFTLWLTNPADTVGVCTTFITGIHVPVTPALAVDNITRQQVSCHRQDNGRLSITTRNGAGPVHYQILKAGVLVWETSSSALNTTITSAPLSPGFYQVRVKDLCIVNAYEDTATIFQPAKLTLAPTSVPATCNTPSNGQVNVTVSASTGVFDRKSGRYDYELLLDGSVVRSTYNSTLTTWQASRLPAGSYQVRVKDADLPDWCSGDTQPVTISPAPTPVAAVTTGRVTCYGGSNGSITISIPQPGAYRYELKQLSDGVLTSYTSSPISGLPAGSYQLTVRRVDPTCNDAYVHPSVITIEQPTGLVISHTKTDITCTGEGDGRIQISTSGGTGTPSLSYRQEPETSWRSLPGTTLSGLGKGTYHLRAVDGNGCETLSGPVAISEPAPLQITGVTRQDIRCLGESGFIRLTATGGTLPYTFEYTAGSSSVYTAFDHTTPLPAGTYRVRVKDANGCTAEHSASLVIAAPAAALDFTYVLSDFNGYNISCFGGSNGTITMTATGGNGSSVYTGYWYAMDNGPYQPSPVLEGIPTGNHSFHVKDARGCTVSKTVTFTQADAQLTVGLSSVTGVVCASDKTGALEVAVRGGLPPYNFSLDTARTFQTAARFGGLAAGSYQVLVQDQNNCTATLTALVPSQYSPIQVAATVIPVSCKGGEDGGIDINVSGGAPPYRYHWTPLNQTTQNVSQVKAGNYQVQITDAAGCSKTVTIGVAEPEKSLSLRVSTTPVCYGKTSGLISIVAGGGTAPYRYSVDNGTRFQTESDFSTVGAGSYQVLVRDAKGCSATAAVTVVQRNDRPEPDFIVASEPNSLDTLSVREISLPKPDSIGWHFDAAAQVTDTSRWAPKIRFSNPGTYTIGMTAYFGGCSYTVSRQLTILPKDQTGGASVAPAAASVLGYEVKPNPSNGQFEVAVKLSRAQQLVLIISDMLGKEYYRNKWDRTTGVSPAIDLTQAPSGTYAVRLITDNDARELRIVIRK